MVLQRMEQEKLRALLTEALVMLCKNSLDYHKELSVEGLIGITLDKKEVLLVNINHEMAVDNTNRKADCTSSSEKEDDTTASSSPSPNVPIASQLHCSTSKPSRKRTHSDTSESCITRQKYPHSDSRTLEGNPTCGTFLNKTNSSIAEEWEMHAAQETALVKQEIQTREHLPSGMNTTLMPMPVSPNSRGSNSLTYSDVDMATPVSWELLCSNYSNFMSQVSGRMSLQTTSASTEHNARSPNLCTVCGKYLSTSTALLKHMRIHTGEKPYQCPMCEMRFNQKGSMERHLKANICNPKHRTAPT